MALCLQKGYIYSEQRKQPNIYVFNEMQARTKAKFSIEMRISDREKNMEKLFCDRNRVMSIYE